jgi:hypothetical protein
MTTGDRAMDITEKNPKMLNLEIFGPLLDITEKPIMPNSGIQYKKPSTF